MLQDEYAYRSLRVQGDVKRTALSGCGRTGDGYRGQHRCLGEAARSPALYRGILLVDNESGGHQGFITDYGLGYCSRRRQQHQCD
jgi:hypothetical protein